MKSIVSTRRVFSIAFSVASIICSLLFLHELKQGLVFAAAFLCIGFIPLEKFRIKEGFTSLYLTVVLIGSAPIIASLSQFLLNEKLMLLGWRRIFLEVTICLVLHLVVFFIFLNYRLAITISTLLIIFLSAANYYVFEFRGNELQPGDFFAIPAAVNVLSEYVIVVAPTVFYAITATVLYLFLIWSLPKVQIRRKWVSRVLSLTTCVLLFFIFTLISKPIHARYFLRDGTSTNGYILNFVLQMKSVAVDEPENYSIDTVESLIETYRYEKTASNESTYPDIIVIMDESFADLSLLSSNLNVNKDPFPFIDSLSENTIHGYALSSVFGGGTPNSEYEFLTGNSLIFLPEGTYVYSQYIDSPVYSMVRIMNKLGYRTIGAHPYLSTGWNRDLIYPLLGFDDVYFLDAFEGYASIRNYISDQGMFEMLTDLYEEHITSDGNPLFLFGVTMQNHGGYEYSGNNYTPSIALDGYSQQYPKAEQYLSLLTYTDSAVEYLIDYFRETDRNVVLVFFGDHYPKLDEGFYSEIHGGSFDTLDEKELQYLVPFFVWTNYPSKEQVVNLTSLNYLSSYVYEAANLPLPPYNQFLKDVAEMIPAMNSQGYYSETEQCFLPLEKATGQELEILNQYSIMVYNTLFDLENLNEAFR